VAGAVVLAIVLSGQTHRGTGTRAAAAPPGLAEVPLGQASASDFDPFGTPTPEEHPAQKAFAVDGNESTFWSTENYSSGLTKPGVGIFVDAKPGVVARALEIRTPEPGFTAGVYGADSGPPTDLAGWTLLAPPRTVTEQTQRFDLGTRGKHYRWYLLWIAKLPKGQAKISEIALFR
jgi:serine/threonine-protein kinase